ncbi:glycerophosphodiester phosphodiesterase family protein [Knoellia sp. CPCC 206450]|uniref:glycerophosphodiester phosphodiesterase family protein n=1 Tax=Knoellia tibetensis TaxID=3404798 RepID=UPI003B4376F2
MTRTIPVVQALATLVVALGLSLAPAPAATAAPRPDVANIAHRGSSGAAPENTIAAVRLALAQGADVVENDIQRTKDGELVILHDASLARTTDVEEVFPGRPSYDVVHFTLAEVKQLDAGSWFAPQFAGEQVPTLREWVEAVGHRAGMLMEAKLPERYPGIEQDIDKELRDLGEFQRAVRAGRVTMQSFNHVWLRAYADLAPDVPVGLLFGTRPTEVDLTLAATWADQVNPALGVVQESDIARIHELGLEAHVWTVNGGADMHRAIRWGVDGVITNYPQVLEDVLRG